MSSKTLREFTFLSVRPEQITNNANDKEIANSAGREREGERWEFGGRNVILHDSLFYAAVGNIIIAASDG